MVERTVFHHYQHDVHGVSGSSNDQLVGAGRGPKSESMVSKADVLSRSSRDPTLSQRIVSRNVIYSLRPSGRLYRVTKLNHRNGISYHEVAKRGGRRVDADCAAL